MSMNYTNIDITEILVSPTHKKTLPSLFLQNNIDYSDTNIFTPIKN
jgi:hypothetical protein